MLAENKAFLHAACDRHLEHTARQVTVKEPTMTVLWEGGVIRDPVGQIVAAKPATGEVPMHLFAQTPFQADATEIAHQEHPDQQLGIDRRAARVAVEIRQMRADAA